MTEILPQTISMSPDGQQIWEVTEVAGGTLYLPDGDPAQKAATAALLLADYTEKEPLGRGLLLGRVYAASTDETVVIKEAPVHFPSNDCETIRAQVALHHGFNTLAARGEEDKQNESWRFRAPKILGGFVLHYIPDPEGNLDFSKSAPIGHRMVMERVEPIVSSEVYLPRNDRYRDTTPPVANLQPQLPGERQREGIYHRAIKAAGGTAKYIHDFDHHPTNLLIESEPLVEKGLFGRTRVVRKGSAVKIDIIPSYSR
ncbi:MAG TPA: hypothetical protein VLH38_01925 [Patescibacteria group bacterium]|nr:hypothetical protein [Patescibacteria group bacterium]